MCNLLKLVLFCMALAIVEGQIAVESTFNFGKVDESIPLALDYCVLNVLQFENMTVRLQPNNEIVENESEIKALETIRYSCSPQHFLNGPGTNQCTPGGRWKHKHPTCTKYCDKEFIKHLSTTRTCKFKGNILNCDKGYLPEGSTVDIRCKPWYVPENETEVRQKISCTKNGWSAEPKPCYATCGLKAPIAYGFDTAKIPWYAAIYYSRDNERFDWFCSGTILDEKTLIAPAHCFWNGKRLHIQFRNFKFYKVAVGKFYSSYTAEEQLDVQYFNIIGIYVPKNFVYSRPRYEYDIAIITLDNYIEFNLYVNPICIEWLQHGKKEIPSDENGLMPVRVFDTVTNEETIDFSSFKMSTLDYYECSQLIQNEYNFELADDKFCISVPANYNGTRGGGFILPITQSEKETYYLWGLPCMVLLKGTTTPGNVLLVFTNIQYYEDEIKFFLNRQRNILT